jgi:hypothetical protein
MNLIILGYPDSLFIPTTAALTRHLLACARARPACRGAELSAHLGELSLIAGV